MPSSDGPDVPAGATEAPDGDVMVGTPDMPSYAVGPPNAGALNDPFGLLLSANKIARNTIILVPPFKEKPC
jgi:hypothetical protein